jgi:hypothetical protein
MANSVDELHIATFEDTVSHLAQQKTSRFEGKVRQETGNGKQAQAIVTLAAGTMGTLAAPTAYDGTNDGWYGDTAWDDATHTSRWVLPTSYKLAYPINENDLVQQLTDPRSSYAQNIVMAHNRNRDQVIINAALGAAQEGQFSSLSGVDLPASQETGAGSGAGDTTTGLDVAALRSVWEKLMSAEVDEMDDELYFVTNAVGLSQLLADPELTSSDYAVVKALVDGKVDSYMGFNFIRAGAQALPNGATSAAPTTPVTGSRRSFAYAKSGICETVWRDINIRVDERPDKNYTWQVYGSAQCGAVRTEDVKVVAWDHADPTAA